jgi:prepilin-type N-terminal cleavage/methylation domain-containing protein
VKKLTANIPSVILRPRRGFTLIELLVVIAVLGILAAVVLVALDPLEQTARSRDSGRINTVAQLGHALQGYATSLGGVYPPANASWQTALLSTGELKKAVVVPATKTVCSTFVSGNVCYNIVGTDAVVWTVLESKNSKAKATNCASTTIALYSTIQGKAGIACVANPNTVTGNESLF